MKIEIDKIKPNPENPRIIKDYKFKKLVMSITNFPEMLEKRPIVVDENMIVLGGNMRLKACQEAGLKKIDVIIAEGWSEKQKKEFIIKDNSNFGEWDWDVLANQWDTDKLKDWGLDIPKWEDAEETESEIEDTGEYSFPDEGLEPSHTRMIQLYLNVDTEPEFKKMELALRKKLGADNATDTVFQVIKNEYEKLN